MAVNHAAPGPAPTTQSAATKKPVVPKDVLMIMLVTIMSIGANLPEDITAGIGLDRRILLIGLISVVAVSLVRYLKFTLILVIAILAVGANLPTNIAEELGVDPDIMFFALIGMVATSFANFLLRLPKGVKPIVHVNSSHGARTLCHAAAKGHASMVYSLLSAGINPNFKDEQGNLPLVVAAASGHALVVKLLLDNGADPSSRDGRGATPLMAAQQAGFSQTALLLKNAELRGVTPAAAGPKKQPEAA